MEEITNMTIRLLLSEKEMKKYLMYCRSKNRKIECAVWAAHFSCKRRMSVLTRYFEETLKKERETYLNDKRMILQRTYVRLGIPSNFGTIDRSFLRKYKTFKMYYANFDPIKITCKWSKTRKYELNKDGEDNSSGYPTVNTCFSLESLKTSFSSSRNTASDRSEKSGRYKIWKSKNKKTISHDKIEWNSSSESSGSTTASINSQGSIVSSKSDSSEEQNKLNSIVSTPDIYDSSQVVVDKTVVSDIETLNIGQDLEKEIWSTDPCQASVFDDGEEDEYFPSFDEALTGAFYDEGITSDSPINENGNSPADVPLKIMEVVSVPVSTSQIDAANSTGCVQLEGQLNQQDSETEEEIIDEDEEEDETPSVRDNMRKEDIEEVEHMGDPSTTDTQIGDTISPMSISMLHNVNVPYVENKILTNYNYGNGEQSTTPEFSTISDDAYSSCVDVRMEQQPENEWIIQLTERLAPMRISSYTFPEEVNYLPEVESNSTERNMMDVDLSENTELRSKGDGDVLNSPIANPNTQNHSEELFNSSSSPPSSIPIQSTEKCSPETNNSFLETGSTENEKLVSCNTKSSASKEDQMTDIDSSPEYNSQQFKGTFYPPMSSSPNDDSPVVPFGRMKRYRKKRITKYPSYTNDWSSHPGSSDESLAQSLISSMEQDTQKKSSTVKPVDRMILNKSLRVGQKRKMHRGKENSSDSKQSIIRSKVYKNAFGERNKNTCNYKQENKIQDTNISGYRERKVISETEDDIDITAKRTSRTLSELVQPFSSNNSKYVHGSSFESHLEEEYEDYDIAEAKLANISDQVHENNFEESNPNNVDFDPWNNFIYSINEDYPPVAIMTYDEILAGRNSGNDSQIWSPPSILNKGSYSSSHGNVQSEHVTEEDSPLRKLYVEPPTVSKLYYLEGDNDLVTKNPVKSNGVAMDVDSCDFVPEWAKDVLDDYNQKMSLLEEDVDGSAEKSVPPLKNGGPLTFDELLNCLESEKFIEELREMKLSGEFDGEKEPSPKCLIPEGETEEYYEPPSDEMESIYNSQSSEDVKTPDKLNKRSIYDDMFDSSDFSD